MNSKTNALIQLTIACLILIIIRIIHTGSIAYLFLAWNLFLAFIPWLISLSWSKKTELSKLRVLSYGIWILFLPNAPYIITDLFHLRFHHEAPMWFDLMLIFSGACAGLMLFYLSVFAFLNTLQHAFLLKFKSQLIYLIMFLTGYGIYLGRYTRLNSWDIVSSPEKFIAKLFQGFSSLHNFIECAGVTLLFALFLYLGYKIIANFLFESKQQFHEIR